MSGTVLTAGDILFTAYKSDVSTASSGRYLQFMLMVPVTAGTQIYFTDAGFRTDTGTFMTNEDYLRWTAQTDLAAGTTISLQIEADGANDATAEWANVQYNGFELNVAGLALSTAGDQLHAIVDPQFSTATYNSLAATAIASITATAGYSGTYTDTGSASQTGLPTGLVLGESAFVMGDFDNGRYNGASIDGTPAEIRAAITNVSNWTRSNNPISPAGTTASFDPINEAPVVSSLHNDQLLFLNGSGALGLDAGANATVTDEDSTDFAGGTLTVSISAGGVAAEDVIGIATTASVSTSGSDVLVGGVQIGTFTGGSGGADLVVSLDTDANAARVQSLVRALTYSNSEASDPTFGARSITITLVDGDGTAYGGHDTSVSTTAVTVASEPAGSDSAITILEDETRTFAPSDFGFTDLEGDTFAGVTIVTVPFQGALLLDGVAVSGGTFVTAAALAQGKLTYTPEANDNGLSYGSFTFSVRDSGVSGGNSDTTPNTISIDVTAVNDDPVVSGLPTLIAGTEDTAITFSTGNGNAVTVSDTDAGSSPVSVILLASGTGTLTLGTTAGLLSLSGDGTDRIFMVADIATINAALEGLTFTPGGEVSGLYNYLTISVNDGGAAAPNLLVNGDAESGTAAADFVSSFVPTGWTRVGGTGSLTAVQYSAAGSDPDRLSSDNVIGDAGGNNYFAGGPAASSSAIMQTIDLSAYAGRIDDGIMTAHVGGQFGGYMSEGDSMSLAVRYLDADGNQLGVPLILEGSGGVGGTLIFPHGGGSVFVPAGTRALEVVLSSEYETGSYADGYADNLYVTLSPWLGSTAQITLAAVDDPGVAQNDAFATSELATVSGDLFQNNGYGVDSDVDSTLQVSAVNGIAASVGSQVTLASGALLTVNSNGTFSYNPNGSYQWVPGAASGSSILAAVETFTYTLAGGGTGTVSVTISGVDNNDVVTGTTGADTLLGGAGADTLNGNDGDDILNGGDGIDQMSGGNGNDRYFVNNAGDTIVEAAGQGTDRVSASVSYTLQAGVSIEILGTTNGNATTAINLTGNEFANEIYGNEGSNIIDGGGAADYMVGGGGDDIYVVDNAGDLIRELSGQGSDTVRASVTYALGARQSVEILEASDPSSTAAINLTGNELANTIVGNAGNNRLSGGGGADLLIGGQGNDFYVVDSLSDTVVEWLNGGDDMVLVASGSYILSSTAHVESMGTTNELGTATINLFANDFANALFGNNGINQLVGWGGNDRLWGQGGDDNLDGGAGADVLRGGAGNDTFTFTDAAHSTATSRDWVADFQSGDKFDLTSIDANSLLADDQGFSFVGSTAFSHTAGELRAYSNGNGTWTVDGDVDGNGVADLSILVTTASGLNAGDFLL